MREKAEMEVWRWRERFRERIAKKLEMLLKFEVMFRIFLTTCIYILYRLLIIKHLHSHTKYIKICCEFPMNNAPSQRGQPKFSIDLISIIQFELMQHFRAFGN